MATMKENPDSWKARGLIKRDFQHDHSGPEEMPHRKKGVGKKYCKKNKGPHVFDTWTEWYTYGGSWRYRYRSCKCGKHGWGQENYQSQRYVTMTYTINGKELTRSFWS
jgi:hypothetical protein